MHGDSCDEPGNFGPTLANQTHFHKHKCKEIQAAELLNPGSTHRQIVQEQVYISPYRTVVELMSPFWETVCSQGKPSHYFISPSVSESRHFGQRHLLVGLSKAYGCLPSSSSKRSRFWTNDLSPEKAEFVDLSFPPARMKHDETIPICNA